MVKAMEFIARQINDEDVLAAWLMFGVADCDIPYGDLNENSDVDADIYIEDEAFAELMGLFLRLMRGACADGLYCDGILSDTSLK